MFLALFWCSSCKQLFGFQPSTLPAGAGLPRCLVCLDGVRLLDLAPVTLVAFQDGRAAATVDEYAAPLTRPVYRSPLTDIRPAGFPVPKLWQPETPFRVWVRGPAAVRHTEAYLLIWSNWAEVLEMVRRGWDVSTSDPVAPRS